MRYSTRQRIRFATRAAAAVFALIGTAVAPHALGACSAPSDYPKRPLTILVPYGPGGGSAQVAQMMAKAVMEVAKVHINLEFKPGGMGLLGIRTYMSLPADGYSVLEQTDGAATNYAGGTSPINPATDFTPLLIAQLVYNQLYIRSSEERYKDWKSFLAYAKAHPGKVRLANIANRGAMENINMGRLEEAAGFKVQTVSYDNPGKRYGALVGGHVDALFEQPGDVKGFLNSGDFKPILTLLPQRPKEFANVPALSELSIHAPMLNRYRGFVVNPKVPADRIAWLACTFQQAWHRPSFQKFLEVNYVDPDSFRDSKSARKLVEDQVATYRAINEKLGLIKH